MQPYYILVADAPPNTAPKKIPTPEPKFAVVAISHVKGEFRYGSGMVELCLYDFNGPSLAFFGVPHFSVIPPIVGPFQSRDFQSLMMLPNVGA